MGDPGQSTITNAQRACNYSISLTFASDDARVDVGPNDVSTVSGARH